MSVRLEIGIRDALESLADAMAMDPADPDYAEALDRVRFDLERALHEYEEYEK